MSHRPGPDRIHKRVVRHPECVHQFGKDRDVAERCVTPGAEAACSRSREGSDYWDAGKLWIDSQCATRK